MILIMNRIQDISTMKVRRGTSWQRYYYVAIPKLGGGRNRRFFPYTAEGKRDAKSFRQIVKNQKENEGMAAFSIPQELRIEALKCQRLLEPAGATLTFAVESFLKHAKPAGGTKSLADAIKEFLASKRKAGKRESYVRNLEFVLNCFKRDFQKQNVNDIGRDNIESWLDRFDNLTSRKNRIRDLSILFEFCRRRGYCGSNPLENIERPIVTRGRPEIFTVSEATALLTMAELHKDLELVPAIAIGLFAGLRIEEIKKLDWRNVHLEDKEIEVDENVAKTRQQRNVEMCDSLVAWLTPYRRAADKVVPRGFRNRKNKLLKLAGVTKWPDNGLRHSFGSYHCAHFQNPNMTAFQMGHGTTDTLFRYYRNYRISKKDAEAYWKIAPAASGNKVVAFSSATA
jgi:integrase/recombinase XerD